MASFAEPMDNTLEAAGLVATAPMKQQGGAQVYEVGSVASADASAEMIKKKAIMDARMARRNKSRAEAGAARKQKSEENSDPNQTPEVFWKAFKEAQGEIQTVLEAVSKDLGMKIEDTPSGQEAGAQFLSTTSINEKHDTSAAAAAVARSLSSDRKAELLAMLTPLSAKIDDMQKAAAGAAFYLPPYDIRSAANSLRKMRATLTMTKELVQPKKKFSFKERRAAKKAAAAAKKAAKKAKKLNNAKAGKPETTPAAKSESTAASLPAVVDYTVRSKRGETISVPPGALSEWASQESEPTGLNTTVNSSKSRDVVLADLEDCVVFLGDTMSALRVDNLRRCHVYGGPVAGSLLLEGCEDCTFWLASRQIRLHHGVRCTFHLRVMSNPIIEDCSELSFAPYNIEYDGLRTQLVNAGLGSTSRNMWKQVQDFKWHRAQHSPNWATINADSEKWIKESRHADVRILSEPLEMEADTE